MFFFSKVRRHLVHLANYSGPPSTCSSDRRGHDLSPHLGQRAWIPSRRLSSWWRTGKTCRSAAPEETATAGWGRCLQSRWKRRCTFKNKSHLRIVVGVDNCVSPRLQSTVLYMTTHCIYVDAKWVVKHSLRKRNISSLRVSKVKNVA